MRLGRAAADPASPGCDAHELEMNMTLNTQTHPLLQSGGETEPGRRAMLLAFTAGATMAAAFGAPATAQVAEPTLAPVVVTGERVVRRAESPRATAALADTPQTIAVIPRTVYEQQGARDLTDVLANTPGITFNAGENGFSTGLSNFSLRGFDASGSIFIDGARDSGAYNRDIFNVEQVEVYKGPAGDNGRGGAGGYVNLVTKTPHLSDLFDFGVSYGFDDYDSDGRVRAVADVNRVFSPTSAGRLNLLYEDGGAPGRAVAQRGTIGIAPSIAFGLGTNTRAVLAVQHVEQDDLSDWGVPAAFVPGMPVYDPTLDGEALRDVFYGLSSDRDEATSTVVLARVDHARSPNINLSTQLRWSSTEREAHFTVPTGYAAGTRLVTTQRQAYARDNQSIAFLTNLGARVSAGGVQHQIAVGVEVSREEADARAFATQTNPGTGAPVPVDNPNPGRAGAFAGAPTELSTVKVDTIAAYLYDTIEISPRWQLTGGLRLEQYDVRVDSRTPAGGASTLTGHEVSRFTTSGRIGLVYKPTPVVSLYASAGVAAQPPASFLSNSDISRGGANAFPGFSEGMNSEDAKTQQSVNYELGGKWELFNRSLTATAALFRTERQNVAITGRPDVTDPVELLGYGEHVVQGLELGLSGYITPQWSVFAGVLFMESERRHSAALDLGRCRANPADYGAPNAAGCTAGHAASGDALAFTPELSASLWTTYEFAFGLTLGGGVRYSGESYIGRPDDAERIIPNDDARMMPDWWSANLFAEYEVTPRLALRLNIENVTDEHYAVSSNWAGTRVHLGNPRSALLSLRFKL